MNKLTASYLAGIIDGEGYVGVMKRKRYDDLSKKHYQAVIKVIMTDKELITWLKESFGGSFEVRKFDNFKWKTSYGWTMRGQKTKPILEKVLPYLRVKKQQAIYCLQLLKIQEKIKRFRKIDGTFLTHTEEDLSKIIDIYSEMRKINKRGN